MTQLSLDLKRQTAVSRIPVYNSQDSESLYDFGGYGIKIVRERAYSEDRVQVSTPDSLLPVLERLYKGCEKEHFHSLILDARNNLDAIDLVSVGSLNASLVHPREVYRLPIIMSAASIILLFPQFPFPQTIHSNGGTINSSP